MADEKPLHSKHISNSIRKSLKEADRKVFEGMSPVQAALEFILEMGKLADRIDESLK